MSARERASGRAGPQPDMRGVPIPLTFTVDAVRAVWFLPFERSDYPATATATTYGKITNAQPHAPKCVIKSELARYAIAKFHSR